MHRTKLLILCGLAVTSTSPTLRGTFVFDDTRAIVKNPDVTNLDLEGWFRIWQNDFWGMELSDPHSHKSYRPLTTLGFRINYWCWGLDGFLFHLTNVFIHGLNSILVYFFLHKCLDYSRKYERICYVASIIFAVHPVHVEAVGALVGRADLGAALVFMGGFVLIPSTLDVNNNYKSQICSSILIAGFSILASLFKENGIVFALLKMSLDVLGKGSWKLPSKPQLLGHCFNLGILVGFVSLRLWYQNGLPVFEKLDNPAALISNKFAKVVNILYIWMLNVHVLIHPIWLCCDWSMGCVPLIQSPLDPRGYLPLLFLGIGARIVFVAWKSKIAIVSLLIAGITFLPSSNLIFTVGFVLAERNLYLPSAGYALFLSYAVQLLPEKTRTWRNLKLMIIWTVIGFFYVCSIQRSTQWIDGLRLYKSALEVCPNNPKFYHNIGFLTHENGDIVGGIQAFRKAVEISPNFLGSMRNLGIILLNTGDEQEGEFWLRKANEIV